MARVRAFFARNVRPGGPLPPKRRDRAPPGPEAALAQLRRREAPDRRRSPGRAVQRIPVVVHAHHLRPLRQGPDAKRGAHRASRSVIRTILDRMRHDGCGGRAGKAEHMSAQN